MIWEILKETLQKFRNLILIEKPWIFISICVAFGIIATCKITNIVIEIKKTNKKDK